MRIQHNIMAMNAYRNYTNNTSALSKNLEKLSSGYRINRAGDDAAGLAISEKMRAQITGLSAAQKNVKDGISLVKTAEGATQEIHDMLNRMVYLAEQSSNGTYQDEVDREAITNEFKQLKSEIDRIADSSNFNGIKLLDGSLDDKGMTTSIKVSGKATSTPVPAVAGKATNSVAFTSTDLAGVRADGGKFKFTISLDDGTSHTVELTAKKDGTTTKGILVGANGKEYGTIAKLASTSVAEVTNALVKAFSEDKVIGEAFTVTSATAGKVTFENNEAGKTGVPQVNAFDFAKVDAAGTETKGTATGVTQDTTAKDAGRKVSGLTEYNGSNYDNAVFTINGKKFVVLTKDHDGSTISDPAKDTDAMHAALGLGKDVNILVGGLAGLTSAADGDNFKQNAALIKEATGLTATAGTTGSGSFTLTPGVGGNGLTLQIGDTSDSYNQLKVSVGDMHTKALKIDSLDLGTQSGAQAAVGAIKDAINYVSQVRGTLGATQNRLEHTQNNLSVMKENIQDAESTIRDTDVAEEMMAYTKNNILVQSAQAMLAQANQIPQGVLQLLG